jgi:hypothetical protein
LFLRAFAALVIARTIRLPPFAGTGELCIGEAASPPSPAASASAPRTRSSFSFGSGFGPRSACGLSTGNFLGFGFDARAFRALAFKVFAALKNIRRSACGLGSRMDLATPTAARTLLGSPRLLRTRLLRPILPLAALLAVHRHRLKILVVLFHLEEVRHVKKGVAFQPKVHECRLHSWQNPGYAPFVNGACECVLVLPLVIHLGKLTVLHQCHPDFMGRGRHE